MGLVTPGIGLVFWMLLSFSIVLYVLKKFAWKPILQALKEREESIENALSAAKNAKEEMTRLQSDNEQIILEAKKEREKLLKEAREIREIILGDAKKQAIVEGNKLIENARQTIQAEKAAALNEIKNQIATLSVQIAEKILQEELAKDKKQQDILYKYLLEMKVN